MAGPWLANADQGPTAPRLEDFLLKNPLLVLLVLVAASTHTLPLPGLEFASTPHLGSGVAARWDGWDAMSTDDMTALLEKARAASARREWTVARDAFGAARRQGALDADDLYALADCAWWLGALDEALPALREAYRLYLAASRPRQAALVALEAGYTCALRGEESQAAGWMGRATRLLGDEPECAEHGYLVYLDLESALDTCDLDTARERAGDIHALGRRFDDANLVALGILGQGRVLVKEGNIHEGMGLLDEAMLAAASDELDPSWAGNIYCHLMVACYEIADWRRSVEWTEATARWCEQMPGAGPFAGICRVHRAQTLQVLGEWQEAEREVLRVCEELAHFHLGVVAEARYQHGELLRKRGQWSEAEAALQAAHRLGRDPQPCLALLRLAQGHSDDAASSIRRALAGEQRDALARARLLPAAVEIGTAVGDVEAAREASDELADIAHRYGTTGLQAVSSHARGAVLLLEGDARQALGTLRDALRLWRRLRAPYETARVRLLLARAYAEVDDRDAATLELRAARAELDGLGVLRSPGDGGRGAPHRDGLTAREAEILAMVATGASNQDIAAELVLSVRTVERHLATVYRKLGLRGRSARAAAVSHALRHHSADPT